jgi:CheY-like chemotaxis protein
MNEAAKLAGRHILVIEDDFLVAQALCDQMREAGAAVLGPVGWLAEALSFMDCHAGQFDGAVVDINLHGEKSYAVADWLVQHNVPFVFATGYGEDAIEKPYLEYPRCAKPFSEDSLISALAVR